MKTNAQLKDTYDEAYITRVARAVECGLRGFNPANFVSAVFAGDWSELELKARMARIAEVLDEMLPNELEAALGTLSSAVPQFEGYHAMFFPAFVELRTARDFSGTWESSVRALAEFTEHSSSEFAVRPMIIEDQPRMLAEMLRWTTDENYHIRRLASEGCRPRLPWAMSLPALKRDPLPIIPILEALRSDDSEYVRRSVANNLNDISKDHPVLVLEIATRWLAEAAQSTTRRRLVKHACRTLLKAGEPAAMRLFGFRNPAKINVAALELSGETISFGGELEFSFRLESAEALGKVRLEYAVHYQKANGTLSPKVFKISEFDTEDTSRDISRRHAFRELSTRRHHPGLHMIAVIINGVEKARVDFTLVS